MRHTTINKKVENLDAKHRLSRFRPAAHRGRAIANSYTIPRFSAVATLSTCVLIGERTAETLSRKA